MFDIASILAAKCANVPIPKATEIVMHYYNSGNLLWMARMGFSFLVPLLFLFTGFSGWLAKMSAKVGRRWFFAVLLYLAIFVTIYQLLQFPLDFYGGYLREHAYGLSNQTASRWFTNFGKNFLVILLGAFFFVWIFYLMIKKSPKRWWVYSGFISTILLFFFTFIAPIWINPLFNQFGPMKDKHLEKEVLALASKCGIEGSRVFEVNKSQDAKTANAYVTGFGSTKRIVFYDTMLRNYTNEEILFVAGHEMGHYVLHHIWWHILYFSLLSFLIFFLIDRSAKVILTHLQKRFGFSDLSNIASFPLILFFLNLYLLLSTPLSNYISRYMEHEADRFGLELVHNNKAAGEMFAKLGEEALINPRPGNVYKMWRSTHPPIAERIEFCNTYCPWKEKGRKRRER